MKRVLAMVAGLSLVFHMGMVVAAEEMTEEEAEGLTLGCGEVKNGNNSYQVGDYTNIEYVVSTTRPVNLCLALSVSVEGWVVGVPFSAGSTWDLFTASLRKPVAVPEYTEYTIKSNHYRIWAFSFQFSNGQGVSKVEVKRRSADDYTSGGDPEPDCQASGDCSDDAGSDDDWSPIIVDMARDGYRLTSVDEGVQFDLNADGIPEQVSWTRADSDEAFLAMDRNGNGRIDSGAELFGNVTPVFPNTSVTPPNGFEALKFLEGVAYGPSYSNGTIEGRDAAFHRLLLWTDRNHNGISEPDELQSIGSAGLIAIRTDYKTKKRTDQYGNQFRQRGTVVWQDREDFVYDVWLQVRQ